MEGSNGLPTIVSGSNNIKISAGTILMCPGSDGYITISGDTTFENNLTGDFTLFYARNLDGTGAGFIAATEVVWSDTEPDPNGQTGFQAWKKAGTSNWQLRSNDSGNVWREVVGGPIADIHYTGENATRIDFDGYRQFNKQQYATKTELNTKQDKVVISTTTGTVALADNTIFNGSELSTLTITNPSSPTVDFSCRVNFTSGATPTTVTASNVVWVGDNVSETVGFVPRINCRYTLMFMYDGSNIRGIVQGVSL